MQYWQCSESCSENTVYWVKFCSYVLFASPSFDHSIAGKKVSTCTPDFMIYALALWVLYGMY